MILKVAMLNVIKGKEKEFEKSFKEVSCIISRMSGYLPFIFIEEITPDCRQLKRI
jgi:heme-degrading monooxygenase HmoA